MTARHRELTSFLLLVAALVTETTTPASDSLYRDSPTGKSNEMRIVSRLAEEKKPFADLWQQYKTAASPEYRRMMLMILISRPSREMTPDIDQELCSCFETSPDPDTALLLGMCTSGRSHDLLSAQRKTTDEKLGKAVRLALARRGDGPAETAFVEEFLRQPVARGERVDWETDQASRESIRNLEYIGSPRCILALFDAAISTQETGTNRISSAAVSFSPMVASMRDFLARIDVPMPSRANKQEMTDWWKNHRAKVSIRLKDKETGGDLPRLKPMRIVVSRD